MRRFALALLVVSGCDRLFALDHLPEHAGDAGRDGVASDSESGDAMVPADAALCVGNLFDEDSDGISDNCDSCPTYANLGMDSDGDGLDNACDRDDAPGGDRILFYSTFAQASDLARFNTSSVNYTALNKGTVTLTNASSFSTVDAFQPTRVEVHITGITGSAGQFTELVISLGSGVRCHVQAADCAGASGTTCVKIDNGGSAGWPHGASTARLLALFGSFPMNCQVSSPTASPATATVNAGFQGSTIALAAPNAGVTIEAFVVYGAI